MIWLVGTRPKLLAWDRQGLTCPLPSHVKVAGPRCPYILVTAALSNFFKIFQTWTLTHDAKNALVTSDPIRVVGRERAELDSAHGREKVNQSIAVWTGLVKGIEKDKTLVDMVITAGWSSEARIIFTKGWDLPIIGWQISREGVCVVGIRLAWYVKENTLALEGRCTRILGWISPEFHTGMQQKK